MATEPLTESQPPPSVAVHPLGLRVPRGFPHPLWRARRWLRLLGPGLITGAADDDPSGIGTYSQVGAAFGTGQLWLALYLLPLCIAVQEMCGRIGLVTGAGIAGVVRRRYNRPLLYGAVLLLALILRIANDKEVMGAFTNGWLSNIVGILTTLAMGIAAVVTLVALFWH